ncbi:MAG: HDOD domain-containing protein, partial [Thermodesulfobacteria bacterium]|nr:HDOD domain-containing protein [Thermodesulfobacteriota bacterium]
MIFKKISRYMALSSGDFAKIFKDFRVPSLPQVITRLLSLLHNPEASMEEVAALIELDPGLASQILKVVNSAFVGLPQPIKSLKQAASVLGLKKIESLAVSFGVLQVVKDPGAEGFDLSAFWTDSLLRALFARELAREMTLD